MSLTTAKPTLIQDLISIFETESEATENPAQSRERLANKMANAIENFVKQGLVTVTTTGTATTQTGTGTIS